MSSRSNKNYNLSRNFLSDITFTDTIWVTANKVKFQIVESVQNISIYTMVHPMKVTSLFAPIIAVGIKILQTTFFTSDRIYG